MVADKGCDRVKFRISMIEAIDRTLAILGKEDRYRRSLESKRQRTLL